MDILGNNQEIAIVAFLNIEAAFNNISFESMIIAARNRRLVCTNCKWMKIFSEERHVKTSLATETVLVSVYRGCLQGGLLFSLLWDFVIDKMLYVILYCILCKGRQMALQYS